MNEGVFLYFYAIHKSCVAQGLHILNFQLQHAKPVSLKASHSASWKWFQKKMKALSLMHNSSFPLYTIIVLAIKSL